MKKIKLKESTLKIIIERIIKEQKTEDATKQLAVLFQKKKNGEDVDKEIKELILNNPNLKGLQGALTPAGKEEIKKS